MAFFNSRGAPPATAEEPTPPPKKKKNSQQPVESVADLRRRARHRLIGAAVLVLIAIVGFPLLFETEPRPEIVDAPITIPDRNAVAPLPPPQSTVSGEVPMAGSLDATEEVVPPLAGEASGPVVRAPAAEAPAAAAPRPETPPAAESKPPAAPEDTAKQAATPAPETKPAPAASKQPARSEEARARAALEGRSPPRQESAATAESGRFIVQIGAFAEDAAVRNVRQQAERLGLKTYTQVVNTKDGPRTRVRVGPYPTRDAADEAAATLKRAGLPGQILSL